GIERLAQLGMHHAREGVELLGPRQPDGCHALDDCGADRGECHFFKSPGFGPGDYHVERYTILRARKAASRPRWRISAAPCPGPVAGLWQQAAVREVVPVADPSASAVEAAAEVAAPSPVATEAVAVPSAVVAAAEPAPP